MGALLKIEDDRKRRIELEAYLDKGRGACHLRRLEIANVVEASLPVSSQPSIRAESVGYNAKPCASALSCAGRCRCGS